MWIRLTALLLIGAALIVAGCGDDGRADAADDGVSDPVEYLEGLLATDLALDLSDLPDGWKVGITPLQAAEVCGTSVEKLRGDARDVHEVYFSPEGDGVNVLSQSVGVYDPDVALRTYADADTALEECSRLTATGVDFDLEPTVFREFGDASAAYRGSGEVDGRVVTIYLVSVRVGPVLTTVTSGGLGDRRDDAELAAGLAAGKIRKLLNEAGAPPSAA